MSDLAVTRAGSGQGRTALVLAVASLLLYIVGGFTVGGIFWVIGPLVGLAAIALGLAARRNSGGREATVAVASPQFPSFGSPLSCSSQHSTEQRPTDSTAAQRWSRPVVAAIRERGRGRPGTAANTKLLVPRADARWHANPKEKTMGHKLTCRVTGPALVLIVAASVGNHGLRGQRR